MFHFRVVLFFNCVVDDEIEKRKVVDMRYGVVGGGGVV